MTHRAVHIAPPKAGIAWVLAPALTVTLLEVLLFGPPRLGATLAYSLAALYCACVFLVALDDVGRALALAIFYFPMQVAMPVSGAVSVPSGFLLVAILVVASLTHGWRHRRLLVGPPTYLLACLFVILCLALFRDLTNLQLAKRPVYVLFYLALELLVRNHLKTAGAVERAWRAFLLGAGSVLIAGIFLYALQFVVAQDEYRELVRTRVVPVFLGTRASDIFAFTWSAVLGDRMRAISFFADPHDFAYYLDLLIPMLSAAVWGSARLRRPRFALALLGLAAIALLANATRASLLAAFVAVPLVLRKSFRLDHTFAAYFRAAASVCVAFVLVMPLFALFRPEFSGRLVSVFDPSENANLHRRITWARAIDNIRRNPLTGTNQVEFSEEEKRFAGADAIAVLGATEFSHNTYLDFGQHLGIPGLCLVGSLFVTLYFSTRNAGANGDACWLTAGVAGAVIAFGVHNLFDNAFYSPKPSLCFWFLVGMAARRYHAGVLHRPGRPCRRGFLSHVGLRATA